VYSGLDIGAMLGPIWFGLMLDHGLANDVLFVIAALLAVAMATVVNVRRARVPQPA
jgi:predicted MFS family arabinose efflux permease